MDEIAVDLRKGWGVLKVPTDPEEFSIILKTFFYIFIPKMKLLLYILLFIPTVQSFAQADLSGYVTFPDSVGIDLIRVEVWLFCNNY